MKTEPDCMDADNPKPAVRDQAIVSASPKLSRKAIQECFVHVVQSTTAMSGMPLRTNELGRFDCDATQEAWKSFLVGFRCYERIIAATGRELRQPELERILEESR